MSFFFMQDSTRSPPIIPHSLDVLTTAAATTTGSKKKKNNKGIKDEEKENNKRKRTEEEVNDRRQRHSLQVDQHKIFITPPVDYKQEFSTIYPDLPPGKEEHVNILRWNHYYGTNHHLCLVKATQFNDFFNPNRPLSQWLINSLPQNRKYFFTTHWKRRRDVNPKRLRKDVIVLTFEGIKTMLEEIIPSSELSRWYRENIIPFIERMETREI